MCGGSVEQFVAPISIVKVEGARNLQICQEGECINVPKGTTPFVREWKEEADGKS